VVGGILAAALAGFVFWRLSGLEKPFGHVSLWLLAAFFAGVLTLGQSFAARGTTQLLTADRASLLRAALYWAGRVPFYYGAMVLLQRALGRGKSGEGKNPQAAPGLFARPRAWLPLAAVLLLAWLPYYFWTFPGVVSNDSITQLKEIFGVLPLEAGNPVFQTFLLGAFARLGIAVGSPDAGVALYCCLQALLMALLMGNLLHSMALAQMPRWLLWASLAFLALCPVFPLFAFCVGKDTNFAMAVLWFSLEVWKLLRLPQEGTAPGRKPGLGRVALRLSLSAALVLLLRNPGAYLLLLTLAPLSLWALVQGRKKATMPLWRPLALALAVAAALWLCLRLLLLPSLPIAPMPETEEYSLPLQQVARVVASEPENLTEAERQTIAAVLDWDQIKARYNGELSDPIKLLWKQNATAREKQAFFQLWLRLAPRHAATYFSATFHNAYGYLCPGYLSTIKPTLLIGKQGRTEALDPFFFFSVNPGSPDLKAAMGALTANPLGRLLVSPGLYGWIVLFALVVLLSARPKRLLLAAAPVLFCLTGCLLSAVNGYFRYAMPLYFCAPFLLALCAGPQPKDRRRDT
jgi:hypothetical protein